MPETLSPFSAPVYSPATLAEAYAILAERSDGLCILAGGTDLLVLMNARQLDACEFLNIWGLSELRGIDDAGTHLRIGALTTFTELIRSELVRRHAPALIAASRTIGAVQIQNRATIAGNIANASPAGDSLPVLSAYDALIEAGSLRGIRRVAFNELYTGYRKTVLAPDEMIVAVLLPKPADGEADFFAKVGTRRAQAISKVVMAAKARVADRAIQSISISVGSVAPTVIRTPRTEGFLTGKPITPTLVADAQKCISQEVQPISDLRSTEYYRRVVTGNLLAKFLRKLAGCENAS